jgi:hypothetical protein
MFKNHAQCCTYSHPQTNCLSNQFHAFPPSMMKDIIALAVTLQMNGYSARFNTSPLDALTAARPGAPNLFLSAVMPAGMGERNQP